MQYTTHNLLIPPGQSANSQVVTQVTPERAGWDYISFEVRQLTAGDIWSFAPDGCEIAIVALAGIFEVETNHGTWQVGGRADVFSGPPHALYLPCGSKLRMTTQEVCEFAVAWVPTSHEYPARLVTPADIAVEIRGGDNATRQINSIIPPGFACDRLVIVEVYTPSGSWSSYPPHKHDVHKVGADGQLIEADLEEIYFYKINPPDGFAIQRVYTDPESPLHQAGYPIDAALIAHNNCVVLVPEGYHPVASAPGYTTYYLNVLAGSAQSLANSDDPQHSWVKHSYTTRDARVPVY